MLTVSIGPLALPVAPLVLMASLLTAATLARRHAPADGAFRVENALWMAAGLGLLAARLGHILQHADAYLAHPWSIPDLRDGGWWAPAGLVVGAGWLAWRSWSLPPNRHALALGTLAGVAIWLSAQAAVFFIDGGLTRPPAPAVVLTEFHGGRSMSLPEAMEGRPTVVNLWATWCPPCRAEMPVLAAAQRAEGDINFIFANQGESAAAISRYVQREGLTLQGIWLDPGSALGPAVGSRGLPTTLFYNAQGQQVGAHVGAISAGALQARLNDLRLQ